MYVFNCIHVQEGQFYTILFSLHLVRQLSLSTLHLKEGTKSQKWYNYKVRELLNKGGRIQICSQFSFLSTGEFSSILPLACSACIFLLLPLSLPVLLITPRVSLPTLSFSLVQFQFIFYICLSSWAQVLVPVFHLAMWLLCLKTLWSKFTQRILSITFGLP